MPMSVDPVWIMSFVSFKCWFKIVEILFCNVFHSIMETTDNNSVRLYTLVFSLCKPSWLISRYGLSLQSEHSSAVCASGKVIIRDCLDQEGTWDNEKTCWKVNDKSFLLFFSSSSDLGYTGQWSKTHQQVQIRIVQRKQNKWSGLVKV